MEPKDWWSLAQIVLVIFIVFFIYGLINQVLSSVIGEGAKAPDMVSFFISFSITALFLIALILYRLKHKAGFYLSLILSAILGLLAFIVFMIMSLLTGYMNALLGNPELLVALRNYANLISILVVGGFILLVYSIWKSKLIFYPAIETE